MRNKNRKGLYLILVVALASLFIASIYFLYTPIDLTNYKNLMLPRVEEAIHARVELEGLVLTILPYPRLILKGLTIKEDRQTVFTAQSVKASLFIMPLVREKRFDIKNLVIEKPVIFGIREADGRVNIVRILKETFVPVTIRKVRIKTGKAHFVDEFLRGGARYEAADIDATFIPKGAADFSYSGTAKLLPSARIKFSGETRNGATDFEGKADIKELAIDQGWPYLRAVVPGERWTGDIDISLNYQASGESLSMQGAAVYRQLTASIPALFDKPISSSHGILNIEVISHPDTLTISVPKAEVYFPDFTIFANLRFDSSQDKNDKLVLNLHTTPIPLISIKGQFFTSILPDSLKQEINATSFRRGQLTISNFKIAGDIKNIRRPDYYKTSGSLLAAIEVRDAEFAHKDLSRVFSMVDGTVQWKDGNLSLQGIHGKYGNSVVEKLEGGIDGLLDAPFVRLNGYGSVAAEEAADELKKWMDKQDMKGFSADGIVPLSFSLSGAWGRQGGEAGKGVALSVSADATSAEIGYSSWVKKEKGFNMAVHADLLAKRDALSIERARIAFGIASALDMKGLLDFHGEPVYQLNIKASDMLLDDIDAIIPYLEKEFASTGRLSADVDIEKTEKAKAPKFKGTVTLRDGDFETRLLPKKVSGLNLTSRLDGNSAAVTIENMKIGNSVFSGNIDIPDLAAANVNFDFTSPYLDDEDIYPVRSLVKASNGVYPHDREKEEIKIPFTPTPKVLVWGFTGKGRVSAKTAAVMGFHVQSLQSDVLLKSDAVLLKAVFISHNGKAVGNFIYSKDSKDAFLWRLNLDASKMELEPLLKQLGAKDKILTGNGDIKLELTAGRGKEMLAKRLDGKIAIDSKNGKLWKFIVLSKVFSIVNIISIDELFKNGLPYKNLAGDFTVRDGVISTDNLLLDSNSMRMSAIGIIDTTDMTIDAKLGLHPFVTVDKIITKIPLAGWIIGGKEKSAISMYYTIKGRLHDPAVEAIPIQALGEGVWGIFKRILRLPVDAVEPLVK
ncbi:MAG: AsmA-like C-terminal domain-containing protein [Deltaproteobacteria bacterium]|nr:AsmA-like C-terminal domain-containing protein [Deltaproteobacteria bacterium]